MATVALLSFAETLGKFRLIACSYSRASLLLAAVSKCALCSGGA